MTEIYYYAGCTSCKKAVSLLDERGGSVQKRDYFKERFSKDELKTVLERAKLRPSEVVSTRAKSYKELGLADRDLSEDELLDLMVQEPTLLRRPIVIGPGGTVVGFNKAEIERVLSP
jgi:Spx/MgsR family transcriptional regulator